MTGRRLLWLLPGVGLVMAVSSRQHAATRKSNQARMEATA